MTRRECEAKLLSLAEQMRAVYMEYNPAGDHMYVTINANGYICVDDAYFNAEGHVIMDVHGITFRTINVTRYSDGYIRYGNQA